MGLIWAARGPRPGGPSRWRLSWPRSRSHSKGVARRAGKCVVRDEPGVLRSVASWRCRRRQARITERCPAAGGRRVFPVARRRHLPLTAHRPLSLRAHRPLPLTGPRSLLIAGPSMLRVTAVAFPCNGRQVRIAGRRPYPRRNQRCRATEPAGADQWACRVTARASGPLLREPGRRELTRLGGNHLKPGTAGSGWPGSLIISARRRGLPVRALII